MLPKQINVERNLGFRRVEEGEFGQVFQVEGVLGGAADLRQVKGFQDMVGGVKIAGAKNRCDPALPTHQFAETLGTELEARIGKQRGNRCRQAMDHMIEIRIK